MTSKNKQGVREYKEAVEIKSSALVHLTRWFIRKKYFFLILCRIMSSIKRRIDEGDIDLEQTLLKEDIYNMFVSIQEIDSQLKRKIHNSVAGGKSLVYKLI